MKRLILTIIVLTCLYWTKSSWAVNSKLEFVPSSMTLKTKETGIVDIFMTVGGNRVVGVDLMLQYDPQIISIEEIINSGAFPSQLGTYIDNKGGTAKVAFSNNFGIYQTRNMVVAQIKIKGKSNGESELKYIFTQGKTNDTNVIIEDGYDSLTSVMPLRIIVQTVDELSSSPSPVGSSVSGVTPTASVVYSPFISPTDNSANTSGMNKVKKNYDIDKEYILPLTDDQGEVMGAVSNKEAKKDDFYRKLIPFIIITYVLLSIFLLISILHKRPKSV